MDISIKNYTFTSTDHFTEFSIRVIVNKDESIVPYFLVEDIAFGLGCKNYTHLIVKHNISHVTYQNFLKFSVYDINQDVKNFNLVNNLLPNDKLVYNPSQLVSIINSNLNSEFNYWIRNRVIYSIKNNDREGSNLTLDEILSSLTCLQLKLL